VIYRILIVEDDPDARHLFSSWLSLAGYAVDHVADGVAALQRLEIETPDLLVLDLGLPLLRGEHVANELAARAHTRHIPIVVVTGEAPELAPAAAACVLIKPVDPDVLVSTVARCLAAPPSSAARRSAKRPEPS
jgi:CheY-like chemotaxis protein